MAAMLRHRGPDGYGLYRDDHVGLAHTRLSIIDISGGSQPIHNEDETVWVVFNGEIFNYVELRKELESAGHRFYTQCDTEVIVHAYEQFGDGAWSVFNGQFALALWDCRVRRLWLVRDRLGILPLQYARVGDRILFASEAKAIFASGHLSPEPDGPALVDVFTRWSAVGATTVFKGVCTVPPGTAVCLDEHRRETRMTYWRPDFSESAEMRSLSVDDVADALEERLTRAVALRLRADVPVGAYLSGGLDSSVIGRLIHRADSSPLQTFAIRFEDPAFDETVQQRRMAGLLGTQHHEILCGAAELCEALPDVIWHCESPLVRTAPAPLFLLSGLVQNNGMKVVLTGEGADEFLAGYDIFKEDRVRRFWARQPDSDVRPSLLSRLYPDVGLARQRQNRMWQQFFGRGLTELDDPFYSHRIRWENTSWALAVLSPQLRNGKNLAERNASLEGLMPAGWQSWRALARAQMVEIATFLSPYLLCYQGDRVAMAHGVEVRYPFLDPDVVDFCARLPGRFKLRGLVDKVVLRRLASRSLPADIWRRPKKPYRAPMTRPFFGERPPAYVDELLSPRALAETGVADCGAAGRLVEKARRQGGRMSGEREEMALVGLLTLQLWARLFFSGFGGRAAEARRRLDACAPQVLVDRSETAARAGGGSPCR